LFSSTGESRECIRGEEKGICHPDVVGAEVEFGDDKRQRCRHDAIFERAEQSGQSERGNDCPKPLAPVKSFGWDWNFIVQ